MWNPLSPLSSTSVCTGVEPPSGAWVTSRGVHPQRKQMFPLPKPSVASSCSARSKWDFLTSSLFRTTFCCSGLACILPLCPGCPDICYVTQPGFKLAAVFLPQPLSAGIPGVHHTPGLLSTLKLPSTVPVTFFLAKDIILQVARLVFKALPTWTDTTSAGKIAARLMRTAKHIWISVMLIWADTS